MIGSIRGQLTLKQPPTLMVEVNGIGYEVQAPMSTFYQLPEVASELSLFTHLIVREDAHQLYGFSIERERDVFRALLKINGVDAKVALAILSGMDGDTFARCVIDGDTPSLTRLPGIGKKTAERLILEMRDRLGNLPAGVGASSNLPDSERRASDPITEAVSALISLGLKPPEASRRIAALDSEGLAAEVLVRMALRNMA